MANYHTNMVESFRFEEASGTPVGEVTGHTLAFVGSGADPSVTEGPSVTDRAIIIDTASKYLRVNGGAQLPWSIRKGDESFTAAFRYYLQDQAPLQSEYENQHIFESSDGNPNEGVKVRAFGVDGANNFGLVLDFYDDSQVATTIGAGAATPTSYRQWQTGFVGWDQPNGIVFIKLNDNSQVTAAVATINSQSSVEFNLGFYDAPANPDFKLLGRLAEYTWWKDRFLTDTEMDDYVNSQEKIPFASLIQWPPLPSFTFPDISTLHARRRVPAGGAIELIPRDSDGLLTDAQPQVFRTGLELQGSQPSVVTVLYRLIKESDTR